MWSVRRYRKSGWGRPSGCRNRMYNLRREKVYPMREMNRLLRTAYSDEEQGNDVQGTPYFTRNTPDKISP
jgi:hypothetical protein